MRLTVNFRRFNASQRQALDAGRNLAVRANAGSGKTSVVVERIVQLLAKSWDDGVPLKLVSIVAITFTRKAAAELQERLAESFRQLALDTADAREQAHWAALTDELPRAMVGTIDSFCARILREFGMLDQGWDRIEPDFEPLEGYDERVLKREAINRVINRLSSLPAHGTDPEETAQVEACRWWAVEEGYDRLVSHLEALLDHVLDPAIIIKAHQDLPAATIRVEEEWAALPVVRHLTQERDALLFGLQELDRQIAEGKKPGVRLLELRAGIRKVVAALALADRHNDEQALRALAETLLTEKGKGTPRKQGLTAVATPLIPLQETWCPLLQAFDFDFDGEVRACEAADRLVKLLAPVHTEYLRLCLSARQFDFLTLARRTRDLLKAHPEVREELKRRWRYVMVDEFQDTNELQWEIISWIVGSGPDHPLDADRLFIVGDPQQSIYRFRHADVSVFARVQQRIRASNLEQGQAERPTLYDQHTGRTISDAEQRLGLMPLAENYRSLSPMPLGLMDHVFRHVFDPVVHGLDLAQNAFEVSYQALVAGLKRNHPNPVGEVRYILPLEQELEESEDEGTSGEQDENAPAADGLGRLQVRAVVDQLVALHGQPKYSAVSPGESLAWRDMAVLLPSRSMVLAELEMAFRQRRVPYIVTKGIGFWQRQEIRDLVNLAACLADTGDELALFTVLRSPLGQLNDTEILFLSQLGLGSLVRGLNYLVLVGADLTRAANPGGENQDYVCERWRNLPDPVRAGLDAVWRNFSEQAKQRLRTSAARLANRTPGSWRLRVDRMAHADLLQRCLEESGSYAIYAADPEADLILGNLERLFDLIRAEESRSTPGLARLARWLANQMNDSLREEQAGLAPGDDAVQIMTVHAAKGLEFPVVAVMKMERKVDQPSRARLLVKNAGERLLRRDADFPDPSPGTVALKVRHPRRPREIYTPRLFAALHRLDQAQQLAESRRLFYVAATRAKERLLLAGRQPARPGRRPESWQKWFEEALGITEHHLCKNIWEDNATGYAVQIITGVFSEEPVGRPQASVPDAPLALDYIHERSRIPTIATTSLEPMRQTWQAKPRDWWLKHRLHLEPCVQLPVLDLLGGDRQARGPLGTVIGTLVHRLFEMPGALPRQGHNAFRRLLEAMAANLLFSPTPLEGSSEEENSLLADPEMIQIVADAVEQIWRRLGAAGRSGHPVRELLERPGETEVPFVLKLGRWQVSGRYDKLVATNGGFEIIDWKTDKKKEPEKILKRHEPQMRLYALALYRAGRAAVIEGRVRVHLAMLHPMLVKPLSFLPADLEAFGDELAHEFQQMDAYEPV